MQALLDLRDRVAALRDEAERSADGCTKANFDSVDYALLDFLAGKAIENASDADERTKYVELRARIRAAFPRVRSRPRARTAARPKVRNAASAHAVASGDDPPPPGEPPSAGETLGIHLSVRRTVASDPAQLVAALAELARAHLRARLTHPVNERSP